MVGPLLHASSAIDDHIDASESDASPADLGDLCFGAVVMGHHVRFIQEGVRVSAQNEVDAFHLLGHRHITHPIAVVLVAQVGEGQYQIAA